MYISLFKNASRCSKFPHLPLSYFSSGRNPDPPLGSTKFLKDDEIPSERVRVIKDRKLLGDYSIFEAKLLAKNQNLNLILFKPNSDPPVCVIDDYFKFLKSLTPKEDKKEPPSYSFDPSLKSKTVQISDNCATPDLTRKIASVRKFLLSGQRVDIVITTKSRRGPEPSQRHPSLDSSSHTPDSAGPSFSTDPGNSLLQRIDFIYSRLSDISRPYTMKNKVNINSRQVLLKFWPK